MCIHELLLRPKQGGEPDDSPIDADGIATSAREAEGGAVEHSGGDGGLLLASYWHPTGILLASY